MEENLVGRRKTTEIKKLEEKLTNIEEIVRKYERKGRETKKERDIAKGGEREVEKKGIKTLSPEEIRGEMGNAALVSKIY